MNPHVRHGVAWDTLDPGDRVFVETAAGVYPGEFDGFTGRGRFCRLRLVESPPDQAIGDGRYSVRFILTRDILAVIPVLRIDPDKSVAGQPDGGAVISRIILGGGKTVR